MNRVISRFIITAWLVLVALSTDTMTTSSSISSNLTLMPAVTYNIEFWLNSNIDQGSSLELRFSTMFNINGSSLSDCKGTIVNGGALGSASCAPSFSTTYYSVTFSSLFSSTQTISYISLQVSIALRSSKSRILWETAQKQSRRTSFRVECHSRTPTGP